MRRQLGFSLTELLIVVAIILIIAAVAIPNLLRSRMAANEASAVESIRQINAAEAAYRLSYPTIGYSSDLGSLAGSNCTSQMSSAACIIDATLAAATSSSTSKIGYFFTYTPNSSVGYTLLGTPAEQGLTGIKNFYSDSSGAIHYNSGAPGGASDSVIQ
jgi:prepilin-type N-terminal cleavage/methylation domain-containing protein